MSRRLILLALCTTASAAPRSDLQNWVTSTDQELPMKLPLFASAKCDQPIEHEALRYRYYQVLFERELGMSVTVVGNQTPVPLVRADLSMGNVVFHLLWNNEAFTREGKNDYTNSGYHDQLGLGVDTRAPLAGTVEAIAAPSPHQYSPDVLWWIGGNALRLMRSGAVLHGAKLTAQQVYGWTPCTFVDTEGHSFTDGIAYRMADIPAAWGPRKQKKVELVKLQINGGAGGPSSSAVITAVTPEGVDAQGIVDAARAKLAVRIAGQNEAISELLAAQQKAAAARAVAPKDAKSGPNIERSAEPATTDEQYRWDPVRRELTIELIHWRGMHWKQTWVVPTRRKCPPGAKCANFGPTDDESVDLDYGIELASIYTYAADGKLVAARDLPLRPLAYLPPPVRP